MHSKVLSRANSGQRSYVDFAELGGAPSGPEKTTRVMTLMLACEY